MAFRLRTVASTAAGRGIVRDRDIDAERIVVGRSAECALHLPDLSLDPQHATMIRRPDGRVAIDALGTLPFVLDGRKVRTASVDLRRGAELRFGGYRVALSQDEDGAALLTIGKEELAEDKSDERKAFSLAGRLPGKRFLAWLLGLTVLFAFLAVPIVSSLTRDPASRQGVVGDAAWRTGPLSRAHRQLEDRCEECHVKPFVAVRDETCLSCHKDIHGHAAPDQLANARGSGSFGDRLQWKIAHEFGKPGPGACSDCHTEHEGAGRIPAPAQAFCADCHGTLKDRLPDTRLGNAADFGSLHPEFQPALAMGSGKLTRVSLTQHPHEDNGLAFAHRLHLDARGGVARMAARIGGNYGSNGLTCQNCHHNTADGVRFLPIDMERDCQSCHSLAYDKVGNTYRQLRHGDVAQTIADLTVAPPGAMRIVAVRSRPGEYASGGTYYSRFVPPSGGIGTIAQAFSRSGVCGECHTPNLASGRFAVKPVTQISRYFRHGWFSHAAHKQEKCTACHAAESSASAQDLMLPAIEVCRTCHLGEDAPRAKVPSGCAMCHDYHMDALAPRGLRPPVKGEAR